MKICLLTNAHISYNPRLLKEADALWEAGYDVRVVSIVNDVQRTVNDQKILSSRSWRCERLNFLKSDIDGHTAWLKSGVRMKFCMLLAHAGLGGVVAETGFCRYLPETLRAVLKEPADLYIAHNLQALPVAAKAAAATGGLLGFDVEDYHLDEDSVQFADPVQRRIKVQIMKRYIKGCNYVTTTSEAMADALKEELSIPRPMVIYNVFPLSYRAGVLPPGMRPEGAGAGGQRTYTAYWFSHVVALDRGLQDFVRAMPLIDTHIDLHLRGGIHGDSREQLLALAAEHGVADRLHFHPPIHADELVRDAALHDFGLALEQPVSRNRLVTVTNKLFTCFLAGNAIIATATPGQCEVMNDAEGTGFIYQPGDHRGLACQVNRVLASGELIRLKCQSWKTGEVRFNWDMEKLKFLDVIRRIEANAGTC